MPRVRVKKRKMEAPSKPHEPPKPWDVPPYPAFGDQCEDDLFASVGRALSGWEWFESQLSRTFAALIGPGRGWFAAMRAYGSVVSFSGRKEMVIAAAEAHFHAVPSNGLDAKLTILLNEAASYAPRRNEIAHGIVRPYETVIALPEERGFVLVPTEYATKKNELMPQEARTRPRYVYSSVEINAFGARFKSLGLPAAGLMRDILVNQTEHLLKAKPPP